MPRAERHDAPARARDERPRPAARRHPRRAQRGGRAAHPRSTASTSSRPASSTPWSRASPGCGCSRSTAAGPRATSRPTSTPSSSTAGPASAHQHRRRWKVRTRVYADTGERWLEVKTRGLRGTTVKERLPHDGVRRLRGRADAWVRDRLGAAHVHGVDPAGLVATLHTSYLRTTLLLPDGAGRATIDRDLRWVSGHGTAEVGDVLVVETKSGTPRPGPLDRRLWELGHRPDADLEVRHRAGAADPRPPAQPLAPRHLAPPRRPPHPPRRGPGMKPARRASPSSLVLRPSLTLGGCAVRYDVRVRRRHQRRHRRGPGRRRRHRRLGRRASVHDDLGRGRRGRGRGDDRHLPGDRREGVDRGDRHHRRRDFERAGLRLKGNSSLRGVDDGADPTDLPWLVRLDEYVDGQAIDGWTEFIVRSNNSETALNEAVALDLLAEAGLASEHAVASSFSVNGGDARLRLVVQNLDEEWEAENFATDGLLYKAEAGGDWSYRGDDPDSYTDVFDQETGDDDLTPLIDFLDFINNSSDDGVRRRAARAPRRRGLRPLPRLRGARRQLRRHRRAGQQLLPALRRRVRRLHRRGVGPQPRLRRDGRRSRRRGRRPRRLPRRGRRAARGDADRHADDLPGMPTEMPSGMPTEMPDGERPDGGPAAVPGGWHQRPRRAVHRGRGVGRPRRAGEGRPHRGALRQRLRRGGARPVGRGPHRAGRRPRRRGHRTEEADASGRRSPADLA